MKKFLIIVTLLVLVCSLAACGFEIDDSTLYANADQYSAGNAEIKDKVEKLEIEWVSGSVDVVTSKEDAVSIFEEAADVISNDMRVHWWLEGTTLHIKYSAANSFFHISFSGRNIPKALTVSLPAYFDLSAVSVDTASADVTISGIKADIFNAATASGKVNFTGEARKIDIDTASGDITLNNSGEASSIDVDSSSGKQDLTVSHVEKAELESSSGAINITAASVTDIGIDTASGDVTCNMRKVPEKCDIETASGKVHISFPEDAAFTLNLDTSSGDFESDFAFKKTGGKYICGSGSAVLNIDTSSADIVIAIGKE